MIFKSSNKLFSSLNKPRSKLPTVAASQDKILNEFQSSLILLFNYKEIFYLVKKYFEDFKFKQ